MASRGALLVLGALLLAAAAPFAAAQVVVGKAIMGGKNQPTPITTSAFGTASVVVDATKLTLTIIASANKIANMTQSQSTPVSAAAFDGRPFGAIRTVTVWNATDIALINNIKNNPVYLANPTPYGALATFVALMKNGSLYVNVHTTKYPGGEIRGELKCAKPSTCFLP